MAAIGIQEWLEEQVAKAIYDVAALTPFQGIVRQTTPDYRPEYGDLLYGKRKYPFIAVASIQAEQYQPRASSTLWAAVTRTITVALIADKAPLETSGVVAIYKQYREKAIGAVYQNRFRGAITPSVGSCVLQTTVRPKAAVEPSAWTNHAKWLSAFDVMVETREVL